MRVDVFANLPYGFVVGFLLFVSGCSESNDPVSVKPKSPVTHIPHLLPEATYQRALSLASTPQEQMIVESCSPLEGRREKPNVAPETVQTMQEILFESKTPEVRAAVAAGLGNAGNVDATPSLLDAMEDDALVTRQAAAKAVGKLMGWRQGFQPDDPRDKRAEAVERFRERWLLFEGSDLYQVATDPEARERAHAIAEKRAKFWRRKERLPANQKETATDPNDFPQPETLQPPQRRPSAEELERQFQLN